MNVNISIDSSVLESRALEALATAVFYRNALANAQGGWDLLNDPKYRELLMQLQEEKNLRNAVNAVSAGPPTQSQETKTSSNVATPVLADQFSDNIFSQLQTAIDDGTYREKFPVGSILPDTWTDVTTGKTYEMPLRIVHYGEVATVNPPHKAIAAALLRCQATPCEVVFSNPSAEFPYGSSRYAASDIDSYLRGDYLRGCSPGLQKAFIANAYHIPDYASQSEIAVKGFFLPCLEELHVCTNDAIDVDQAAWEYFLDTPSDWTEPCRKRVFLDPSGTAQRCWLRSARRGSAYRVWTANTDGSANYYSAYNTYACAPACVIVGHRTQQYILAHRDKTGSVERSPQP